MSTETEITPATKDNKKPRGKNNQPPRQYYRAYSSRSIKRATESFKRMVNRNKTTPEEKSALAFFTLQPQDRE